MNATHSRFWVATLLITLLITGCSAGSGGSPTATEVVPVTGNQLTPTVALLGENAGETPVAAAETVSAVTETAGETPVAGTAQPSTPASGVGTAEAAGEPDIECPAPGAFTPALTEGPYFKAGSPERTSLLEEGVPGTPLRLTGYVLTEDCQPVPNAKLEFWQTDGEGNYDNQGYRMRGHQFTDESGRYTLETVIPGEYPGRTPHIHVKVQAPNGPELTSQVFMPDSAQNQSDRIFDQSLIMTVVDTTDGVDATFNFVIRTQ